MNRTELLSAQHDWKRCSFNCVRAARESPYTSLWVFTSTLEKCEKICGIPIAKLMVKYAIYLNLIEKLTL